ncbi:hypothetical protein LYSIN_01637 [Lysinibacillus sphaericus]|uniref:Uncharacterized protein n=1 Tax=Lysinibacillus sphaericus TaxID=1421 RepID=A0A2S5D1C0_LYSSH|nr:hypothetical protein LYSIN_01637 [Lysinibacillus sphaericus]
MRHTPFLIVMYNWKLYKRKKIEKLTSLLIIYFIFFSIKCLNLNKLRVIFFSVIVELREVATMTKTKKVYVKPTVKSATGPSMQCN